MVNFRWDNHNHQLTDLSSDVVDSAPTSPLKETSIEGNPVNGADTCKPAPSPFQKSGAPVFGFGGPKTSSRPQTRNIGKLCSITFKKDF